MARSRLPYVFDVYLDLLGGHVVKLRYDDLGFTSQLTQKFAMSDSQVCGSEVLFVTANHQGKASGRWDAMQSLAIISGKSFGLLKSAVSGIGSKMAVRHAHFPVHAAAVSVGGTGLLLVGAHGFGKTTLALALAAAADTRKKAFVVLGDDWCVTAISREGRLLARTFDPSISINEPALRLLSPAQRSALQIDADFCKDSPKVSVPSYKLSTEPNSANSLLIDSIFLLDPTAPAGACAIENDAEFSAFVAESAYHYPFEWEERALHHQHWAAVARHTKVWKLGRSEIDAIHADAGHVFRCLGHD